MSLSYGTSLILGTFIEFGYEAKKQLLGLILKLLSKKQIRFMKDL